MGYRPERKIYKLIFPEYDGLEVKAVSVSTGTFLQLTDLAELADEKDSEAIAAMKDLFAQFANSLREWNIEDEDGTPVPATLEGLYLQEFDFVMTIIMAWLDAMGGIEEGLKEPSSSGNSSLEASLMMVPRSESQAS